MSTSVTIPKKQSLLRSTSLVSIMTFLSRVVGFLRDMVIAQSFGAGASMDAFFVAFRIPNFMRRLFAEGAFSQAFVPVLAEYQTNQPHSEVRQFIARIAGGLGSILLLVTLFCIIAAPLVVLLFAPGFGADSVRATLATEMLRFTFPYLMFISLTAMAGAVLNTYGYFGIPAFTPVLLNVCMIIAAIYLSPHFSVPVMALAIGVFAAGIVQFLFQLPFLNRHKLLVRPAINWQDPGVLRVLKLMLPALFGVSIAQINLLIDTVFASFLKVGSVSWLYYTDRLADFPLGVFGVAIATVILPHLSRRHVINNQEQFSKALDWGLRLLLLLGTPAAMGLAFFSLPLISACFAYGAFNAVDALQTQKSLITLAMGIPAFMMVKVLASAFYAGQNIKTPVKVGAFAMLVNTVLCAILIVPLAHAGLTLASAIAGYVNCGILLLLLCRRKLYSPRIGWWMFLIRLAIASSTMSMYLFYARNTLDFWLGMTPVWRLLYIGGHVGIAMGIYFLMLGILGMRIRHFRGQFGG